MCRNGIITTIAGSGTLGLGNGAAATAAKIGFVVAVALDNKGNLYIADDANSVRKIGTGVIITTLAGNGNWGFSVDEGEATSAELDNTSGVAVDT